MNIRYLARVLGGVRIKNLMDVIGRIHEKTGKNRVALFFDIINCSLRYGAGYHDYIIFEFYNLTAKQRKTYLTRVKNKKLISRLNDEKYSYIFDEKNVFDRTFREFLGREVIDLADIGLEEFKTFLEGKKEFFAKPYIGESGKGIEKIKVDDFPSVEAVYDYVVSADKNFGVIEQVVEQHPDASRIYPLSLNCLRIVTLVNEDGPHILYAVFKMGNGGKFVDNLENGGLACCFDLDTGTVVGQGHTSALINHDSHPYTGIPFIGYQLPFMNEVKELVKKAAMVVPQMKYIGWDVCFTVNGPAIIEGNDYPAYDFPQLPDPNRPKIGLLPKVQELLPDFK